MTSYLNCDDEFDFKDGRKIQVAMETFCVMIHFLLISFKSYLYQDIPVCLFTRNETNGCNHMVIGVPGNLPRIPEWTKFHSLGPSNYHGSWHVRGPSYI